MNIEEKEQLLKQGWMLPVMEHFYTLQGEGFHAGKAAYFIRLGGCNVGCHWCDVKDSWDENLHPLVDVKDLAATAAQHCKTIIITGGEPLMWNLSPLTDQLKTLGCKIHIETSGSSPLSGCLDWITLSPKKRMLPKEEIYARAHELKVVVFNQHDFIFAQTEAKKVSKDCQLFLQAEWSKKDEIYPQIFDFILKHPEWKLSTQIHKYLNIR